MLWLSRLDCTELTLLGKPRCLYGEKLTRLVGLANRFFGIRDFPIFRSSGSGFESKFGIESMRWRWNTKNNPRDYGIVQSCVGIAELKPQSNLFKTHRYCCRALVHFHFSAFSSIFPPNWTAKQSVVFFSKPVFNPRRAGLRYSRCRPFLWPLSRSWPTRKSAGCLSLMPDSSYPYRYFGIVKKKPLKLKVTRRRTKIH